MNENEQEQPQESRQSEAKEEKKPEVTFTQADIDRIVKERIARVKDQYKDYDDLKTARDKLAELERKQMSEQDKLQADLKALHDRVAEAEKARDEALALARERTIRAEITSVATTLGLKYAADVYKLVDLSAVTVDETGAVVGAQEAVEAFLKARPDYPRVGKAASPSIDGEQRAKDDANLPKLTPAQERAAKALGVSPEAYAKRLNGKGVTR